MKKILVVDDEEAICNLIENILAGEGYTVIKANRCDVVLSMLDEISPDLILMDIVMPEMSGIELCKKIKADPSFRNIPIIMMTGYDNEDRKVNSCISGANEYITKPFDVKELIKRVKNELDEVLH